MLVATGSAIEENTRNKCENFAFFAKKYIPQHKYTNLISLNLKLIFPTINPTLREPFHFFTLSKQKNLKHKCLFFKVSFIECSKNI